MGMTKQNYSKYWGGLIAFMKERGYLPEDWDKAISRDTRQRIYTYPLLGDELRISAGASPGLANESPYIQVDLTANPTSAAKSKFLNLHAERVVINKEINSDPPVKWFIRSESEESWALTRRYAVPQDERDWSNQYEWLARTLDAFNKAFRKRIV
jgi:hypothetical protein